MDRFGCCRCYRVPALPHCIGSPCLFALGYHVVVVGLVGCIGCEGVLVQFFGEYGVVFVCDSFGYSLGVPPS